MALLARRGCYWSSTTLRSEIARSVSRFTPFHCQANLIRLVTTILTRRRHAYRTMARLITPLVEERLERSTSKSDPGDEPVCRVTRGKRWRC